MQLLQRNNDSIELSQLQLAIVLSPHMTRAFSASLSLSVSFSLCCSLALQPVTGERFGFSQVTFLLLLFWLVAISANFVDDLFLYIFRCKAGEFRKFADLFF